jgi:hypothetical protein
MYSRYCAVVTPAQSCAAVCTDCNACVSALRGVAWAFIRYNSDSSHLRLGVSMSISVYELSVSPMLRGLDNLSVFIDKAAAFAEQKKFDSKVLAEVRIFPDMLPFTAQVQIACDTAKGAAARLAGVDVPKHEDTEKTLAELKARILKTATFLKSIKPEQMQGDEHRPIILQFPQMTLKFTALSYLTDFVLPNFYFHLTTAYALLRHNGVELSKRDYLGSIQ